jgi:hypothetical protein
LEEAADALTSMGVEVRYPGLNADAEDAREAVTLATQMREMVRRALGLE